MCICACVNADVLSCIEPSHCELCPRVCGFGCWFDRGCCWYGSGGLWRGPAAPPGGTAGSERRVLGRGFAPRWRQLCACGCGLPATFASTGLCCPPSGLACCVIKVTGYIRLAALVYSLQHTGDMWEIMSLVLADWVNSINELLFYCYWWIPAYETVFFSPSHLLNNVKKGISRLLRFFSWVSFLCLSSIEWFKVAPN